MQRHGIGVSRISRSAFNRCDGAQVLLFRSHKKILFYSKSNGLPTSCVDTSGQGNRDGKRIDLGQVVIGRGEGHKGGQLSTDRVHPARLVFISQVAFVLALDSSDGDWGYDGLWLLLEEIGAYRSHACRCIDGLEARAGFEGTSRYGRAAISYGDLGCARWHTKESRAIGVI